MGNDNTPDADVLAASGREDSTSGMTVVVPGYQDEGCTWESPTNNDVCDCRASKRVVLRTGTEYDDVLRELWDWSRYAGNTAGCAQGIATIWRGGNITCPFLAGCGDGPS